MLDWLMCQQRHRVWFTSQDQDGRRSRSGPSIAEESGMYTLRLTWLAGALGSALLGAHPCAAFEIETAEPSAIDYGAHPRPDGWVDFGLHAPAAETIDLLLYDAPDARTPAIHASERSRPALWPS
jgi:hypothetical protein